MQDPTEPHHAELNELELEALHNADRQAGTAVGRDAAVALAARSALNELAHRRRAARGAHTENLRPTTDEPIPLDDLRQDLRAALELLVDDVARPRAGSNAELTFAAAHATAAAALAYVRLGGDLELPGTTSKALDAELRVAELEDAIGRVESAVDSIGAGIGLLTETPRLEPLAAALENLLLVIHA